MQFWGPRSAQINFAKIYSRKNLFPRYDYLISCVNPVPHQEWVKPDIHPCRIDYQDAIQNMDDDYANLLNTVQRHTKCNSEYCLRTNIEGEQYCRFHYPFELQDRTHIKYQKLTTKSGTVIRPEIVAQRNDARLNRHQQILLQGWRANCDIQLVIDHHACVEYKGEKMSSIARNAYVAVVSKVSDVSSAHNAIKKLMIKYFGERDMGKQEVMHQILSLKLYTSSFQTIIISLDNSRLFKIKENDIYMEKSQLDLYACRNSGGLIP